MIRLLIIVLDTGGTEKLNNDTCIIGLQINGRRYYYDTVCLVIHFFSKTGIVGSTCNHSAQHAKDDDHAFAASLGY